jgi:lysophospholipase L1-like esterase
MLIRNTTVILILMVAVSSFNMQVRKKVIFFGDSITEAGVNATGFITRLQEMLQKKGLSDKYEVAGAGIGGNKIYDLYLRMDSDVIAKKPDMVVIWVGVNDVWHKRMYGTGTDPDKFEKFYNAVIKKLQALQVDVYICTPAAIGEKTDFTNELDGDLNKYAQIIRNIAQNNHCQLIDLRKAFLEYNIKNNAGNVESGILTTDRVHLNDAGNNFVAEKMWQEIFSNRK